MKKKKLSKKKEKQFYKDQEKKNIAHKNFFQFYSQHVFFFYIMKIKSLVWC